MINSYKLANLRWLFVSCLVITIDQWSKWVVLAHLTTHQRIPVLPGFLDWTLTFNEGVAFSMFHNGPEQQRWWLAGFALLVSCVFVIWMTKLPKREYLNAFALAMIIGGAIGNVIDRIRLGHVVDFILAYYQNWYWPAFNIADSAIVCGAGMLLIASFLNPEK